jgi:hypothetical protein
MRVLYPTLLHPDLAQPRHLQHLPAKVESRISTGIVGRQGASDVHTRTVQAVVAQPTYRATTGRSRPLRPADTNAQRHTTIRSADTQRVLLTRQRPSPRLDSRDQSPHPVRTGRHIEAAATPDP